MHAFTHSTHTHTHTAPLPSSPPPVQRFPNDLIRLAPDCYLLQPRYLFSNLARGKIAPRLMANFQRWHFATLRCSAEGACCRIDRGSSCSSAIRTKWSPLTWFTDGSLHIVTSVDRAVCEMRGAEWRCCSWWDRICSELCGFWFNVSHFCRGHVIEVPLWPHVQEISSLELS